MEKYTSLYLKNRAAICGGISLCGSLIVLVVTLIFDIMEKDVLFSLVPLGLGILAFLVCLLKASSFKSYIKRQGVPFNDKNARPLFKGSEVYLSENWLIAPCSFAAPRENIKKVSTGMSRANKNEDYSVSVITTDGKIHTFSVDGNSSAKKVINWFNRDAKQEKKK